MTVSPKEENKSQSGLKPPRSDEKKSKTVKAKETSPLKAMADQSSADNLKVVAQKTTDSKSTIDWQVTTAVEITNELQLSEHGNTPDHTFEEEVIDEGI